MGGGGYPDEERISENSVWQVPPTGTKGDRSIEVVRLDVNCMASSFENRLSRI